MDDGWVVGGMDNQCYVFRICTKSVEVRGLIANEFC